MVTKPLEEQKHIKYIIETLGHQSKIRRSKLFKLVQEREERLYNKKPHYQTINRDIRRLIDKGFITVVSGGPRSQILTLSSKGKRLLKKIRT